MMPTWRVGDMFDHLSECDVLAVTTNATITNAGDLVMGRGAAKRLKSELMNIDKMAAEQIRERKNPKKYGFFVLSGDWQPATGLFQVKLNWWDRADLDLIKQSVEDLHRWSAVEHPDATVFLNYPGIGNGGRSKVEVAPLLQELPINVHIWQLP